MHCKKESIFLGNPCFPSFRFCIQTMRMKNKLAALSDFLCLQVHHAMLGKSQGPSWYHCLLWRRVQKCGPDFHTAYRNLMTAIGKETKYINKWMESTGSGDTDSPGDKGKTVIALSQSTDNVLKNQQSVTSSAIPLCRPDQSSVERKNMLRNLFKC